MVHGETLVDTASTLITEAQGRYFAERILLPIANHLNGGADDWSRIAFNTQRYQDDGSYLGLVFDATQNPDEGCMVFRVDLEEAELVDEDWRRVLSKVFASQEQQAEEDDGVALLSDGEEDDEEDNDEETEEAEYLLRAEHGYVFMLDEENKLICTKNMGYTLVIDDEEADFQSAYNTHTDNEAIAAECIESFPNLDHPMLNVIFCESDLKSVTVHDLQMIKDALRTVGLIRSRRKTS